MNNIIPPTMQTMAASLQGSTASTPVTPTTVLSMQGVAQSLINVGNSLQGIPSVSASTGSTASGQILNKISPQTYEAFSNWMTNLIGGS